MYPLAGTNYFAQFYSFLPVRLHHPNLFYVEKEVLRFLYFSYNLHIDISISKACTTHVKIPCLPGRLVGDSGAHPPATSKTSAMSVSPRICRRMLSNEQRTMVGQSMNVCSFVPVPNT
jgi:hypothetical protein